MLVIGLVLSVVGIGFLCWLLFTLAVYALPFFAGLTADSPPSTAARASSAPSLSAFSPAARPWRSGRSPSRRCGRRSSAPQSRSSSPCRPPSPATTRRLGSPISACRPKAGARPSRLSALSLSAARPGRACRCLSRRMSIGGAREVRHRFHWRERPGTGEPAPSSSSNRLNFGAVNEARPRDRERQGLRLSARVGRRLQADRDTFHRRRRRLHGLPGRDAVLSERQGFLFFAWKAGPLVRDVRRPPRLLPRMLFGARTTRPLHGLIWPKDGFASIA